MELKDLITELCSLPSPSGFEDAVRERIADLAAPFTDRAETDSMGNLYLYRDCGRPDAGLLMLNAHMDEIGFIITGYEKGFLRFSHLGGVDPRMLPAGEVKILTDPPIYGVIDAMPPHVLPKGDSDKAIAPDKLFIDAGLAPNEAEKAVPLGTAAVFAGDCRPLGDRRLCGKSLDDRSCAAILLRVLENPSGRELNTNLCLMISAQEELGKRGAAVGAYRAEPDLAVVLDVTHAATPDSKPGETMEMGKGAAIGVGPNLHRDVTKLLFDIAAEKALPCQTEVMGGSTGTDAWAIQVSRRGVPTGLVSLPVKYMHSPVEVLDLDDAEAISALLTEFVSRAGDVLEGLYHA